MSRMVSVAITGFAALFGAATPTSASREVDLATVPLPAVREIADVTLRDVAVALYDAEHPTIYYNPRLMARLGPELETFFMAHEYAHILLKHTRASALGTDLEARDQALQGKELEADCLATRRLGPDGREATLAAVRFFARLGDTRFDNEHPTGSERAARILACMTGEH